MNSRNLLLSFAALASFACDRFEAHPEGMFAAGILAPVEGHLVSVTHPDGHNFTTPEEPERAVAMTTKLTCSAIDPVIALTLAAYRCDPALLRFHDGEAIYTELPGSQGLVLRDVRTALSLQGTSDLDPFAGLVERVQCQNTLLELPVELRFPDLTFHTMQHSQPGEHHAFERLKVMQDGRILGLTRNGGGWVRDASESEPWVNYVRHQQPLGEQYYFPERASHEFILESGGEAFVLRGESEVVSTLNRLSSWPALSVEIAGRAIGGVVLDDGDFLVIVRRVESPGYAFHAVRIPASLDRLGIESQFIGDGYRIAPPALRSDGSVVLIALSGPTHIEHVIDPDTLLSVSRPLPLQWDVRLDETGNLFVHWDENSETPRLSLWEVGAAAPRWEVEISRGVRPFQYFPAGEKGPAEDGERVSIQGNQVLVALDGLGGVLALDVDSGREVWRIEDPRFVQTLGVRASHGLLLISTTVRKDVSPEFIPDSRYEDSRNGLIVARPDGKVLLTLTDLPTVDLAEQGAFVIRKERTGPWDTDGKGNLFTAAGLSIVQLKLEGPDLTSTVPSCAIADCGEGRVDLASDPNHCGACNASCDGTCDRGSCVPRR